MLYRTTKIQETARKEAIDFLHALNAVTAEIKGLVRRAENDSVISLNTLFKERASEKSDCTKSGLGKWKRCFNSLRLLPVSQVIMLNNRKCLSVQWSGCASKT